MEAAGALLATPKVPKQLSSGWKCVDGSASDLRAMSKESHAAMPVIKDCKSVFLCFSDVRMEGKEGKGEEKKKDNKAFPATAGI